MKTFHERTVRYWNRAAETLPQEKLRALQARNFRRILERVYRRSRSHRRLCQETGLEPGENKTYEDGIRVRKVEKAMMRDVQRRNPFPYDDGLCMRLEGETEFHQTSGTTGTPSSPVKRMFSHTRLFLSPKKRLQNLFKPDWNQHVNGIDFRRPVRDRNVLRKSGPVGGELHSVLWKKFCFCLTPVPISTYTSAQFKGTITGGMTYRRSRRGIGNGTKI